MKSTTIAYILGLASLTTASPISTINVYLPNNMRNDVHATADPPGPCLGVCFPEKQKCPEDYTPYQLGKDCWTCCYDTKDEASFKTAIDVQVTDDLSKNLVNDVHAIDGYSRPCTGTASPKHNVNPYRALSEPASCLLMCSPEKKSCPENMVPFKHDDCWTCCTDEQDEVFSIMANDVQTTDGLAKSLVKDVHATDRLAKSLVKDVHATDRLSNSMVNDVHATDRLPNSMVNDLHALLKTDCYKICVPSEPECPAGWYAKQNGFCWTCCEDS